MGKPIHDGGLFADLEEISDIRIRANPDARFQATLVTEAASLVLPANVAGPNLQERDGVLIDARWHGQHRRPSEWRWSAVLGRLMCHDCFSNVGYPLRPPHPCPVCKADVWYERLPVHGNSWLCGCCHPGLPPEAMRRLGL